MQIYYFGCIGEPGHYMTDQYGRSCGDFIDKNPWGYTIDGGLCPSGPEIEGRALIHHKDGWTALSFWDRSVDKRGKCNSNFIAEGTHTFEEMVALAKQAFPKIIERFTFPIVDATVVQP